MLAIDWNDWLRKPDLLVCEMRRQGQCATVRLNEDEFILIELHSPKEVEFQDESTD